MRDLDKRLAVLESRSGGFDPFAALSDAELAALVAACRAEVDGDADAAQALFDAQPTDTRSRFVRCLEAFNAY